VTIAVKCNTFCVKQTQKMLSIEWVVYTNCANKTTALTACWKTLKRFHRSPPKFSRACCIPTQKRSSVVHDVIVCNPNAPKRHLTSHCKTSPSIFTLDNSNTWIKPPRKFSPHQHTAALCNNRAPMTLVAVVNSIRIFVRIANSATVQWLFCCKRLRDPF